MMSKKYRLKINYSEITEDNFEDVQDLRESKAVDEIFTIHSGIGLRPLKDHQVYVKNQEGVFIASKTWLTEIKEPLSFEEWDKENFSQDGMGLYPIEDVKKRKAHRKAGWNACLENQKLGVVDEEADHQAMVNYLETLQSGQPANTRLTWNAALKYARGLS